MFVQYVIVSWCTVNSNTVTYFPELLGHCLLYQLRYSVAWIQFFSKLHYSVNSNVHFRSFSGLYFPGFGLNMYQKNSECGYFSRSVAIYIYLKDILIVRGNSAVKTKSNILFQESFLRQHNSRTTRKFHDQQILDLIMQVLS